MAKLRAGVIGLGMGAAHVKGFQAHPEAEVVAVADVDEAKLQKRGDKLGIEKRYTDAVEMLDTESLDIVSVATPNKFHMPLTVAALEKGAHVLCEKPMAMNAGEAREMINAAERAGRRIMINFSYRFTDQSWALRKCVDEGLIGEVYFARTIWHRRRGMPGFGGWFGRKDLAGGGPLIDLGVHRLDLALWLMGHPRPVLVVGSTYDRIASPIARAEGKDFDVEDLAAGFVKFESGASLVIEASWAAHIAEGELMETRLLGEKGGLVQKNVNAGYQFEAELFTERAGCHYDWKLAPPFPRAPSAMRHFVDCILEDRPHIATGEEGLIVMQILDALYASARTGEPVGIE